MLPLNVFRYGRPEDLPHSQLLQAGPLTMLYEAGDLRYIRYGKLEIVRRIYVAIRDRNWGTIPGKITDQKLRIAADHFDIAFTVENRQDAIDFRWRAHFQGDADGRLTLSMDGQAISTFRKNRIGFCVLQPASVSGHPCTILHVDGNRHTAMFPVKINPDQPPQPFTDIHGLSYILDYTRVEISFEGDIFEMEDQRNWTDASFKTYSTPLRLPYPTTIQTGTEVRQVVTINTSQVGPYIPVPSPVESGVTLQLTDQDVGRLPVIGTGLASHNQDLTDREIDLLNKLRLSHLRTDIWPRDSQILSKLTRAVGQSNVLNIPLCLALHLSENGEAEISALESILQEARPSVSSWLIYPTPERYLGGSPTATIIAWFKKSRLFEYSNQGLRLVSGSDADLIFLQRNLPPIESLDAICFSITPQNHAFDNASLMETLEAQRMAVTTARQLSGLPVFVSPITLRPRYNPYATGPVLDTAPGELPPQVDYRQPTLFAAAWLVGSLRAMSLGGASEVTYFEATGWRGMMETEDGSPVTDKFLAIRGGVYPLYHILADVADFIPTELPLDYRVLAIYSSDDLKVQGLGLSSGSRRRLLVANLRAETQCVEIQGLPERMQIRYLDETNVYSAVTAPEAYRLLVTSIQSTGGKITIQLLPYGVATIDC